MAKHSLPTYVIVELLIRLSQYNSAIGDYKNHSTFDTGVIIRTSAGSITFPFAIINKQRQDPASITDAELSDAALLFRVAR